MPRTWDGYSPWDDFDPQAMEKEDKAHRIHDAEKAVVAAADVWVNASKQYPINGSIGIIAIIQAAEKLRVAVQAYHTVKGGVMPYRCSCGNILGQGEVVCQNCGLWR